MIHCLYGQYESILNVYKWRVIKTSEKVTRLVGQFAFPPWWSCISWYPFAQINIFFKFRVTSSTWFVTLQAKISLFCTGILRNTIYKYSALNAQPQLGTVFVCLAVKYCFLLAFITADFLNNQSLNFMIFEILL